MIKDDNIMYLFYNVINQLEPNTLLDVGMFFKAIGSVSRQIVSINIPDDIYITGVQMDNLDNLDIYNKIYDRIIQGKDIRTENKDYYLAVFLSDLIEECDKKQLFEDIKRKVKYMLIYKDDIKYLDYNYDSLDLCIGDVQCLLILLD